jgi:hypothetical protein
MAMVELPAGALDAMTSALRDIFPGIAPYRDGIGDARIWFKTPIRKRLKSPHDLERFRALVGKKDFEYKLKPWDAQK